VQEKVPGQKFFVERDRLTTKEGGEGGLWEGAGEKAVCGGLVVLGVFVVRTFEKGGGEKRPLVLDR